MSAAKSRLANLGLLAAVTLAGAGAIELGLRAWFPVGAVIYQVDDHLLYTLVPGAKRFFVHSPANGGGRVLVEINDQGFRGEEVDLGTKRGPRIAVYGDSFIEAEFSPLEETFAVQLSRALGGVEVINAGVVGYGPDQVALRIERELDRVAPDLVIAALFVGNDFGELARNRLFTLGPGGELVALRPKMGAALARTFEDARRAGDRPAIVRGLSALLREEEKPATSLDEVLATYIEESLARQRRDYYRFVDHGERQVDNVFVDTYDADVAFFPDEPGSRWKRAVMEGLLARIDGACAAKNVRWLAMIIPDPIDVAQEYDITINPTKYANHRPTLLTGLLAEIAERRGFAHVNLFETLREHDGERLFFRAGDNHWTALGQKRAADRVAEVIRERGLLTSRSDGAGARR